MASHPERRLAAWGAAAAALSAAGVWFGTGLVPIGWLTWIAPLPVLVFAPRAPLVAAALSALAAWLIGGLNLWAYLRVTLGVPWPVALLATALPAAVFASGVLLARTLALRHRWPLAVLALPATWTVFELASARLSPHGTFGSLAATQMELLPVVQLAAVCGSAGIGFLLLLVASAVAMASLPGAPRWRLALATAAVVALALGYGTWRLSTSRERAEALAVGLAASDRPDQPAAVNTEEGRELQQRLVAAIGSLRTAGAEVIVLPETTLRAGGPELGALTARLAAPLDGSSVLVAGVDRVASGGEDNAALAITAGGATLAVYRKQHLLPFFEARYQPGTQTVLVRIRSIRAGLAICKDLDFPALGRSYSREGASILLVPAWDFAVDGWLHSRMAVLRGVEGGFAVARVARNGRLTLSDDRGRLLAEARSDAAPVATVLATVPVGPARTIYSSLGDWFGWASCALLAFAVAAAVRRPRPPAAC